jgi:F-type H+-transporting ATPase subunit delta
MRNRGVTTRYARALFLAARQAGELDGAAESYAALVEALASNAGLKIFLEGPQVSETEKKSLIRNVLGDRVEPTLLNFLLLLVDKDRIEHLAGIQTDFQLLVEKEQGLSRAQVTTAVPLPEDLERDLVAKLEKLIDARVILVKTVDPSVMGGVCVTLGDQVIDGTVRTNLARLGSQLAATDVR